MKANPSVFSANEVTRRYGEGETAVDALRGVSLAGTATIAGQDVGSLSDNEVTLPRRRHIGFVFQFFNLLPMLTAEENVVLPLSIASEKPDPEWLGELLAKTRLRERG